MGVIIDVLLVLPLEEVVSQTDGGAQATGWSAKPADRGELCYTSGPGAW